MYIDKHDSWPWYSPRHAHVSVCVYVCSYVFVRLEHSEATGILEIVPAISAWLQYHMAGDPVPTFTWTINNSTGNYYFT